MARQQHLRFPDRHGGKRTGAGRKPKGARAGVPHRLRQFTSAKHPLHVTIRVEKDVPGLRRRHVWLAARAAIWLCIQRFDFRICHVSILGNHLHLIVEADSREALARGMKGFQISLAKRINTKLGRRGRVFVDRYHAVQLTTPTQTRNALLYCLNNWRKHGLDRGSRLELDPYASGHAFPSWREHYYEHALPIPEGDALPVVMPHTWMLTQGYKRGGPPPSVWDVPSQRP